MKRKAINGPFRPVNEAAIWDELGSEGFRELVAAFYRQVPADDLLGPMYPKEDLAGAEERLFQFLCFRFGGKQRYLLERGHPRLRQRHLPFRVGEAERDRWMQLMGTAMGELELSAAVAEALHAFFAQVADFMRNS